MYEVAVESFEDWRDQARVFLARDVSPGEISWSADQPSLFAGVEVPASTSSRRPNVPGSFLKLASTVACHRDPTRWPLLYRMLFRLTHGERNLLEIDVDDDVRRLLLMDKAVRHDIHKMRAFVRFRRVDEEQGEHFIAWYRPDHLIVRRNAPFFVRRFGAMRWTLLTPDDSAYWDGERLHFGPGVPRSAAPADDRLEQLWRAYYASTFNPGRLNLKLMRQEMPVRFWDTLPEARVIGELALNARGRVEDMIARQPRSAREFIPPDASLPVLRDAVQRCQACDLYCHATQAVFGEGPSDARIALVGEQPGDNEDLAGRAFVGPAGQLLDRVLADAGLDRGTTYITGAVRHFKFVERGKRRIHQTPRASEIAACRPWLEAEMAILKPRLIVCLGATAAQSVLGRAVRIGDERGRFIPHHWAELATVTTHPSAILRAPEATKQQQYKMFVDDLRRCREIVGQDSSGGPQAHKRK